MVVRPLPSAWLANHAVDVADAAGAVHRLVLRRWARPGWADEDPDFTAAREAAILEPLAPTPVPAPALVAADPDAAVCDVPALLLARLPGAPPDLAGGPLPWSRAWPPRPPLRPCGARPRAGASLTGASTTPSSCSPDLVGPTRAVRAGVRRGRRATSGRPGLLHPPRLPPRQHPLGRWPADRGGGLSRQVVGAAIGRPQAHGQPGRGPGPGRGRGCSWPPTGP